MGIEFELKFCSTPEKNRAIRSQVTGEETLYRMATTYYDTPDGALSRRHFTLRRRMENDRSVCTLKTPTGGYGRNEFEVDCPSIEEAIPMLCKLCGMEELPALLAGGVREVCSAAFTRVAKTVTLPDCTVELALDEGILAGGGKQIPLCEVEVELKDGSREAAALYALGLAAQHALEQEPKSKFARAKALAQGN